MPDNAPFHIAIVGGGTAGWICANLMSNRWQHKNVKITLIEAPDIEIIGVGEGSTPTLKRFFSDMQISESEWMPACNATYKVNIRFDGWSPSSNINQYSHPFISQLDTFSERPFFTNCYTRRLGLDVEVRPEKFLFNAWLAKHKLSPVTPENFSFRIEYGYHFDSAMLGDFLSKHAINNGVEHQLVKIIDVKKHADGSISELVGEEGQKVSADFYVDCSGFASILHAKTLGVNFKHFKENLFNDSAVVLPTNGQDNPSVETVSTALSNGWAWQIPLRHRTGNGYVYSSDFQDKDAAESELRKHLGLCEAQTEARHLKMRVGQVEHHWYKNCLALGLSQGFIEPLEATALHLVQISAEIFMDEFESAEFSNINQQKYNQQITERFERVRDYIVSHYKLNTRTDSEYWQANRENTLLSDSLIQLLNVWYKKEDICKEINRQGIATHFSAASWHCLLAGYGAFPELASNQPGIGDLFKDNGIGNLFSSCILNFSPQSKF